MDFSHCKTNCRLDRAQLNENALNQRGALPVLADIDRIAGRLEQRDILRPDRMVCGSRCGQPVYAGPPHQPSVVQQLAVAIQANARLRAS